MMMRPLLSISALALLTACAAPESSVPETTSGTTSETPVETSAWTYGGMVTAGDPRAVAAGVKVLEAGGSAVDAAIAVHSVLGLVEPQSSGLGGGAFMVVYDHASGEITVLDGRERAPLAADENLFLDDDGNVMDFITAWQSGRSVGAPGQVKLYEAAHDLFGKVEWGGLFTDAIDLADQGFVVSPRLSDSLSNPRLRAVIQLDDNPVTAAYFYPEGNPLAAGDIRTNPDYADTLRKISAEGANAFYTGEIADEIVAAVQGGAIGGKLSLEDLSSYDVVKREAICGNALGYKICSAPPPSSGSSTQPAIVGLYERMTEGLAGDDKNGRLKAFVDAQRLAYADRDHYIADPDFVTVKADDFVNPDYLDARAKDRFAPDAKATPGDPGAVLRGEPMIDLWGRDLSEPAPGTTHISIIDTYGNAVSMTATVEAAFGSSRWAAGFLLNNQLTDFSRDPLLNGKPVANAPAAGKHPRSSMSPTLVFDEDTNDLVMVTGSPGGNSIIAYVSKTLVGVLDWGLSAEEAVAYPNIIARGDVVGVEIDNPLGPDASAYLKSEGYTVQEREGENSGLNIIVVDEDGLHGAPDPRREGVAVAVSR